MERANLTRYLKQISAYKSYKALLPILICVPIFEDDLGETIGGYTTGEVIVLKKDSQIQEKAFTLLHEAAHIWLEHLDRREKLQKVLGDKFDPLLYNLVADIVVNNFVTDGDLSTSVEELYLKYSQQRKPPTLTKYNAHKSHSYWQKRAATIGTLVKNLTGTLPGTQPAYEQRHIIRCNNPIDLDLLLQNVVADVTGWCTDTYTYTIPNKRHLWRGQILPGIVDLNHNIAVLVDTSGSISDEMLGRFVAGVQNVVMSNNCIPFRLFVVDATIHHDVHLYDPADIPKYLVGRGGTNFDEVFEKLTKENFNGILIGFTDLMVELPSTPPNFECIWVVPHESFLSEGNIFGTIVSLL